MDIKLKGDTKILPITKSVVCPMDGNPTEIRFCHKCMCYVTSGKKLLECSYPNCNYENRSWMGIDRGKEK